MKRIYIIYTLVVGFSLLATGCYKDDTIVDTRSFSEISIQLDVPANNIFDIEKHDMLALAPLIEQSKSNLPLQYEWEIDQALVSTNEDFVFVGEELGTFKARLKVTNEDGSAFKEFTIRVNSPYEEDLFILAEGMQKEGSLAFIRKYANKSLAETTAEEAVKDVFSINNNGTPLGNEPSDIVQRGPLLFLSVMGDGSIRLLNHQTLEMQSQITAPEFPDFKPYRLNIPDNSSTSAIILNKDGKLYNLATNEHLVLKNTTFDNSVTLAPLTQVIGGLNLPYLKELEKEFKDHNIVFLSISLDRNKKAWRDKVAELDLHGHQWELGQSGYDKLMNIGGIPHFILYDPQGKLLQYRAPRPSSPEIREVLYHFYFELY